MLVIAQQDPRCTKKYLVHIVGGNSRGNAVDICCCQLMSSMRLSLISQYAPERQSAKTVP
jgi:hypothetical protein